MEYIRLKSRDVFYNLALEEYLLEHSREDDCLLLWKNDSSIVVGRNQNVFEEINLKEAELQRIKIARRNTGGGTVFHDAGNLNYSFMTSYRPEKFSDYASFTEPVITALNELGAPAKMNQKGDIIIDGFKVSGSAQTIKKGRLLHHGTLLFDADLPRLRKLLGTAHEGICSKAVKSVRSKVANVRSYLNDPEMQLAQVEEQIIRVLARRMPMEERGLSAEECRAAALSGREKYASWAWNYGMSPDFTVHRKALICGEEIEIRLSVAKGIIAECWLKFGNRMGDGQKERTVQEKLENGRYSYLRIRSVLEEVLGTEYGGRMAEYFC